VEDLKYDVISKPRHYQGKTLEVIQVIERLRCGAHIGNVIKYILRAPHKGNIQDLQKAIWYLDRAHDKDVGPLRTQVPKQPPYTREQLRDEFSLSAHIADAYGAVTNALEVDGWRSSQRGWLAEAIRHIEAEIESLSTVSGGAG
jgi:hypothetical protein